MEQKTRVFYKILYPKISSQTMYISHVKMQQGPFDMIFMLENKVGKLYIFVSYQPAELSTERRQITLSKAGVKCFPCYYPYRTSIFRFFASVHTALHAPVLLRATEDRGLNIV